MESQESLILCYSSHPLLIGKRRCLISSDTYGNIISQNYNMDDYVFSNEHFSFIILSLLFPNKEPYFVQAIIIDQGNLNEITLSENFPFKYNECCFELIRPLFILLNHVIIQAYDISSLHYAYNDSENFTRSVINYEKGIIFARNDDIFIYKDNIQEYKYRILHCYPFKQGLFSPNHVLSNSHQQVIILPSIYETNNTNTLKNYLSIDQLSRSILSKDSSPFQRNVLSPGLGSLSLFLNNKSDSSCIQLIVKRLEKSIKSIKPKPKYRDIHREIFVTMQTLSQLQIASGSWVIVEINSSKLQYIVKIYAVDLCKTSANIIQEFKDNRVYLPPLVLFRLGINAIHEFSNIRTFITIKPLKKRLLYDNKSNNSLFPCSLSHSVTLSRISAPKCNDHISSKEFGKILVDQPQIICEGDIISIPKRTLGFLNYEELLMDSDKVNSSEIYDELLESTELIENTITHSKSYIYFKILKVECKDNFNINKYFEELNNLPIMGYIDKSTSFIEKSSINSYIPTCFKKFTQGKLFLPPFGMKQSFNELLSILVPFLSKNEQILHMQCSILIHGLRGNGKRTTIKHTCNYLGIHFLEINCYDLVGQGDTETIDGLRICFEQAHKVLPCILLLRHIEALEKLASQQQRQPHVAGALREFISNLLNNTSNINKYKSKLITIASTSKLDQLSSSIRSCFRHEIRIEVPEESQRKDITRNLLQKYNSNNNNISDILIKPIALKTAGYTSSDLKSLFSRAYIDIIKRLYKQYNILAINEWSSSCLTLQEDNFEEGFSYLQKAHAEELGAPKIPNIHWNDVGGLVKAKKEILDTIQLPLEHPELFSNGISQRSGVLLYGPPGTGKTLLAKAVATECSLNFLSVKGPELLNMYVGESEKNVRDVFEKARNAKPCVVFFDELDSLAPSRGQGSDSGGVMDRVVSQLLAELDGLQKAADVFIIGATNRPDLLDSALLRPGRLDRLVYLGVCETTDDQIPILKALTRKFDLDKSVNLEDIAMKCPKTFTGADFYALCSDTLLNAMKERIDALEKYQNLPNISDNEKQSGIEVLQNQNLEITNEHFIQALKSITPSVSPQELERYKQVQKQFT